MLFISIVVVHQYQLVETCMLPFSVSYRIFQLVETGMLPFNVSYRVFLAGGREEQMVKVVVACISTPMYANMCYANMCVLSRGSEDF